jgi:hypothetical protein
MGIWQSVERRRVLWRGCFPAGPKWRSVWDRRIGVSGSLVIPLRMSRRDYDSVACASAREALGVETRAHGFLTGAIREAQERNDIAPAVPERKRNDVRSRLTARLCPACWNQKAAYSEMFPCRVPWRRACA